MNPRNPNSWIPFAGWVALWTPAMIAASYEWGHGDYYDYGWFVPAAAAGLAALRWARAEEPVRLLSRGAAVACLLAAVPWILALRVLGQVDPSWRLPMGLLAVTAALGGHALIARTRGWEASWSFLWITLLCLSAVPWPTLVEVTLIHQLTQGVISTVVEVFHLIGRPVMMAGDRLTLHGVPVEITDGCSGIRSFQSFVMATWFFAEWQRLTRGRALVLLVCAFATAFVVNACRAFALAAIRFDHGQEAFDRAHDGLGLLAFVASGLVFYWVSGRLGAPPAAARAIRRRSTPIPPP